MRPRPGGHECSGGQWIRRSSAPSRVTRDPGSAGGRIGEVLAVRWNELDLTLPHPTLTFSRALVFVKGRGVFRQPWTKSVAGHRTVVLPHFAVETLLRRHTARKANPLNAVFASRRGSWLSPSNVRRQWRQARTETGLEWVIPHTFRKTVATLLDREADTSAAAEQLGHVHETVTRTHYIERANQAADVSDVLQMLAASDVT